MKEGDRIQVYLDKEIKRAKSTKKKYHVCPGVLKLWECINGKTGVITEIVNANEIWARGDRTQRERRFSRATLKVIG